MTIDIKSDERIVMTLDAGGTNFVFSAMQGGEELIESFSTPSYSDDLDMCASNIIDGFEKVELLLTNQPEAISFAFPGPADYDLGIIGNLPNFKAFNGDFPLGPMLEDRFKIPVFINNDGNLFAYGEALAGILPEINKKLEAAGSIKQFRNLIGLTLGTGFGGGIVMDNKLLVGDSSCGAEVHNMLNKFNVDWNAEESVSTRAIKRVYAQKAGINFADSPMPKDIAEIATGATEGNRDAAIASFNEFGEALGSSVGNVLTLIDGIVVIGGGITAAWNLFSKAMFDELNRKIFNFEGIPSNKLSYRVFNLEDDTVFSEFARGNMVKVKVPGSDRTIKYDNFARTGVGISKLGASKAIALGAYAFALQKLNE